MTEQEINELKDTCGDIIKMLQDLRREMYHFDYYDLVENQTDMIDAMFDATYDFEAMLKKIIKGE